MNLKATREQLKKIQLRLEEYRAALRLAGVEIEQRSRDMIALTHYAYQATHISNPAQLLQLALTQALETLQTGVGAIILIDFETRELILGAQQGLTPPLSQILTGQRWSGGAIALMPHLVSGAGALLECETGDDEAEQLLLATGEVSSLVSLPLKVASRLMGALLVGLQDRRRFKSAEVCFLMALSQEVAITVDSLRLREGLWYTAESLLGNQGAISDWSAAGQTVASSSPLPQFELTPDAPPMPPAIEEDLEQVMATVIEAETEMQQQNADLQALNTIADIINRSLDLEELLQSAVEQTQAILQADATWVYLVDEKKHLALRAHVGLSNAYVRGMHHLALGDGLEGWVAKENKARFVEAVSLNSYAYKIWVDKEGLHSLAAVPITRPEPGDLTDPPTSHVVGVLVAGQRAGQARTWTARDARLLNSIANQLAPTIDNARLYAQVRENEANLRAGNQVLREINEMLIQKNVFLEEFIQRDLEPTLTMTMRVLQLLLDATPALIDEQSQEVSSLQKALRQLSTAARGVLNS